MGPPVPEDGLVYPIETFFQISTRVSAKVTSNATEHPRIVVFESMLVDDIDGKLENGFAVAVVNRGRTEEVGQILVAHRRVCAAVRRVRGVQRLNVDVQRVIRRETLRRELNVVRRSLYTGVFFPQNNGNIIRDNRSLRRGPLISRICHLRPENIYLS